MSMRFQASQFSTSTSLHHVSKIVSKCIKIVSTDVRKYKIFSGEIPRTPLSRGGNAPSRALPLLVPSALVNVFNLSWPDHFSKADDGPADHDQYTCPLMHKHNIDLQKKKKKKKKKKKSFALQVRQISIFAFLSFLRLKTNIFADF